MECCPVPRCVCPDVAVALFLQGGLRRRGSHAHTLPPPLPCIPHPWQLPESFVSAFRARVPNSEFESNPCRWVASLLSVKPPLLVPVLLLACAERLRPLL